MKIKALFIVFITLGIILGGLNVGQLEESENSKNQNNIFSIDSIKSSYTKNSGDFSINNCHTSAGCQLPD